jgi:hypothetical protein
MAHSVEKLSANARRWSQTAHPICPDCGEWYAAIKVEAPVLTHMLYHCCSARSSARRATYDRSRQTTFHRGN